MIRTLVVEDDPMLAEAHLIFTGRVPGFNAVGAAHLGADALRIVAAQPVDLILLDVYLPDMSGVDVCRALRARGSEIDVIAVTSARDLATVRGAVSVGVMQYLLKPFSFAAFRGKLEAYAEYRRRTAAASEALEQADVDGVLAALHEAPTQQLPKGLAEATLAMVVATLRRTPQLSAAQIAASVGISAQTARRYLSFLTRRRVVTCALTYGRSGRPEGRYTWTGPDWILE